MDLAALRSSEEHIIHSRNAAVADPYVKCWQVIRSRSPGAG